VTNNTLPEYDAIIWWNLSTFRTNVLPHNKCWG